MDSETASSNRDSEVVREPTDYDLPINSHAYWNKRFRTNWRERGGSEQTLFFYKTLLDYLPRWFTFIARQRLWSICDWGCGLGEGSDLLSQAFPGPVTG